MQSTNINSNLPNKYFSEYYALFLGKYLNTVIYRSLFRFDLSNFKDTDISKAELSLFIMRNDNPSYVKKFNVYRIIEDFDITKTNYTNQPAIEDTPVSSFEINNQLDEKITIDITELVRSWCDNSFPNFGLMLKSSDETINSLVAFYSTQYDKTSYIPYLNISTSTLEPSKKHLKSFSKINFSDSNVYFQNGNIYYEDGDYTSAFTYYMKAYKHFRSGDKHSAELLFKLILTLDILEYFKEELEIINAGLYYYPNFTDLEFLRASLFFSQQKYSLAIKSFENCIKIGEPPFNLNFIVGVGSFKSHYALAQTYFELKDYDEAYLYCLKSLDINPNFTQPISLIAKILLKNNKDFNYIKYKLESYFQSNLSYTDYMILSDIYLSLSKYDISYNYLLKAESIIGSTSNILYNKGICLLYQQEYEPAFKNFNAIVEKDIDEKVVFMLILCEILDDNMSNALKLINTYKKDNKFIIIYESLYYIMTSQKCDDICTDKQDTREYLDKIFDLLNILIKATTPDIFEKSLHLLNLIENDNVLLMLAKLYFNNDFYELAYNEFIRSISMFNTIDLEGLNMITHILSN